MEKQISYFLIISTFCVRLSTSEVMKLFNSNVRVLGVFKTFDKLSLLKCGVLYEISPQALSFNYNSNEKICELSAYYPEGATGDLGWKVYARVVDGSWSNWVNWGACSVTCGDGSRSRTRSCNNPSPSNGGEQCQGSNVYNQNCNAGQCSKFVNGYYLSTETTTWDSAKTACEYLSASLIIFDNQQEIDNLMAAFDIQNLNHWIGMKCTSGSNCLWIDGRAAESGFQAWAPNEPNWGDCVYIGMQNKLWDDTGCTVTKHYICEQN